jgi:hypothetical protein
MSSSLGFDVFNTFQQGVVDLANGVGLPENFYEVPAKYRNIQYAIDCAVADGYNGASPAVIFIRPNDTTAYVEDLVLHDGVYLMSSVPNVPVMVTGNITFGTNTADLNGRYMLQDLSVSLTANGSGLVLDSGTTMTAANVTLVRCDLTNTGTTAGDNCVNIRSAAGASIWLFDDCVLSAVVSLAAAYALNITGVAHSVTLRDSTVTTTGADTTQCVFVDTGSTLNATDCNFNGTLMLGATSASFLILNNCTITHPVLPTAPVGFINFVAENASIATVYGCTFVPNTVGTVVSIFVVPAIVTAAASIIRGGNCIWNARSPSGTVAMQSFSAVAPAVGTGKSYWDGPPVIASAAAPSTIPGTLWMNTTGNAVLRVP